MKFTEFQLHTIYSGPIRHSLYKLIELINILIVKDFFIIKSSTPIVDNYFEIFNLLFAFCLFILILADSIVFFIIIKFSWQQHII